MSNLIYYMHMGICEIKSFFSKNTVVKYLEDNCSVEYDSVIKKLKNSRKLEVFPYDYVDEYKNFKPVIYKDSQCGLFYTMDSGHRLYFSRKFRFKWHAARYYRNLCIEQDVRSPHCYLSDGFYPKNGSVLLDVGAAEGIFTLRNIDRISEAYCFECDEEWIEALEHTFSFCRDKIKIIRKYVGAENDDYNMTLDSIDSSGKSFFLKMDIEGAEVDALKNSITFADKAESVYAAVCTYHRASHEKEIETLFRNYEIEKSDGYMLFYYDKDFSAPYVRRGVIRIKK